MGIPEDVAQFEQSLSQLIVKYEQYFLGVEKREPLKLLNEVEALGRKYPPVQIVNTMTKFKYIAAIGRLNSYKQYWNRINRLIEDGKYSRDRFKMEMHQKNKVSGAPQPPPHEKDTACHEADVVFRAYIDARKACNLPVETITPAMVTAALDKQKPAIMSKFNCKRVEFAVVIEEGVPKIKARPKA